MQRQSFNQKSLCMLSAYSGYFPLSIRTIPANPRHCQPHMRHAVTQLITLSFDYQPYDATKDTLPWGMAAARYLLGTSTIPLLISQVYT